MVPDFKTSLLREKFTLTDPAADPGVTPPIIALSNRIVLQLQGGDLGMNETFVIRTQNMHSCTRFAAAIVKEYIDHGPITPRGIAFSWNKLWTDVTKGYEKDWNPSIWGAVYNNGKILYEDGEHHPLLDVIEKCDAVNKGDYSQSISFAEAAFQKTGKLVKISHDSNIALIVSISPAEARCGVILRGANKKTTFNYTVKLKNEDDEPIRVPTVLTASAAFLEGVQLAYAVGFANRKRLMDMIVKYSDEDRKGKRGAERLVNLTGAIEMLEKKYTVTYRPERPDFPMMVREAEDHAGKMFRAQEEQAEEDARLAAEEAQALHTAQAQAAAALLNLEQEAKKT